MKNINKSRLWQTVTTLFQLGWVTGALIFSLILIRPHTTLPTGDCSAPDGVCTTSVDTTFTIS